MKIKGHYHCLHNSNLILPDLQLLSLAMYKIILMVMKLHCYIIVQDVKETSTIFQNYNHPIKQTYSTNQVVNVYTCTEYINVLARSVS